MYLLICLMIIVVSACPAFPQSGNSDRCEVVLVDVKGGKSTELGTFTTVVAEEELTTRTFRLPGTKLYIVASVFYTDESMASERGASSISLNLTLSKSQKRDVLRSLNWAKAEMPLNGFDVGRVGMMVRIHGRPRMVLMECREPVRR
ncbi:MAG TPA: hypothetical protein VFR78_18320 [Pyrinomonadaceae bacterium]|nr:hypothetical protein [Pyrinomonadaceae bacterium]